MKKTTGIIIGVSCAVLVISLILIFTVFLPKLEHDEQDSNLTETLKALAVDVYENEFKTLMPTFLEQNGSLTITLDSLLGMNKDIKIFEEHSCDYSGTYAELIYDEESSYKVEINLQCNN